MKKVISVYMDNYGEFYIKEYVKTSFVSAMDLREELLNYCIELDERFISDSKKLKVIE